MPLFRLTIAYDGTGFVGWQRQAAGESIQGLLEGACEALDGRPVTVIGAGRTDAGVHALAQVASVALTRQVERDVVVRALNVRLPLSIRVLDAVEAPAGFHPRFDAQAKSYRYRIACADVLDPFERAYVWHVPGGLDVEAMAEAAPLVEGAHDFASFQGTGSETCGTDRTVFSSRVSGGPEIISYDVTGSGFLRHMVRNIVGSLVEIGRGRRPPGWLAEVLAARDRAMAGRTAPPQGLFLVGVDYGPAESGTGSKI
jgi:tRNA pseudouridine38-40 synthase